jgi:hypothetical protein
VATEEITSIHVNPTTTLCKQCHGGEGISMRASGGYFRTHQPGKEMANTKHNALECVTCHDPHKPVLYDTTATAIRYKCENCHGANLASYTKGSPSMSDSGVTCIDCHMPKIAMSAHAEGPYEGDARTHLVRINPDSNATQYTSDSANANPYLTVEFACLSCHGDSTGKGGKLEGKDKAWASEYARSIHRKDAVTPVFYTGGDVCATCHEGIKTEWDSTDHGEDFRNSATNQSGRDFIHGYGGGCQPCHVTGYGDPTGWLDVASDVNATLADSVRLESIQCEACHGPSSQHAFDGAVKYKETDVDYATTCVRCHATSYDALAHHAGPADSLEVEGHSSGLHHPQAHIFYGLTLYEYPGGSYSHSKHVTAVANGCATCHMYPATGHDILPDNESCNSCHLDFATSIVQGTNDTSLLNFNYQDKQDTIAGLMALLDSLLNKEAYTRLDSTNISIDTTVDTTVTPADTTYDTTYIDIDTVKAAFSWKAAYYNMRTISSDKSLGIHDYGYIKGILEDAIEDSTRYLNILP